MKNTASSNNSKEDDIACNESEEGNGGERNPELPVHIVMTVEELERQQNKEEEEEKEEEVDCDNNKEGFYPSVGPPNEIHDDDGEMAPSSSSLMVTNNISDGENEEIIQTKEVKVDGEHGNDSDYNNAVWNNNNNNTAATCPVCLTSEDDYDDVDDSHKYFVFGPCKHKYCVPCIEHILNTKAELRQPKSGSDLHLSAPTLGRCPICRMELSLFDLKYYHDRNEQKQQQQQASLHCPPVIDYDTNRSIDCPLLQEIYIPYRGKIGQLSFHWDWTKLKRNTTERPFLNATDPIKRNPNQWRLDSNNKLVPSIIFLDAGCHFHAESRTFHGRISWQRRFDSKLNGSHTWNIVLGFPKDYRFLSSGRIHMLKGFTPVASEDILNETCTTEDQKRLCHYPLDGRWTVSWTTATGENKRSDIHVRNNEYVQSGYTFYLILDKDPKHPTIQWPRSNHSQTCISGVDLYAEPLGPAVGTKIKWTATSPSFPGHIIWERQTVGPLPMPKVISFGMGTGKQLYQKFNAQTSDAIPKYNGTNLWGNIFCKRLHVGSASYHFLSPRNSYISYQHPACRDLPPLDDGTPLPTRVDFHNIDYNEEERKLTATIEWEQDFGISWNDNVRWTLTMYFDTEYMIILKGGIQCEWCHERRARSRPPRPQNQHRPPPVPIYVPPTPPEDDNEPPPTPERNEEWVMSGYGHDQLYINAACLERYRDGTVVVDYKDIAKSQCQRLQGEGATKRSLGFLNHVFELAADRPNSNPIDFLL